MVCWFVQEKVIQKYYVLEGLILKKQSILCMNSPLFGQRSSTSWVEGLPRCRSNITLKWLINTFSFFFHEFLSQQCLHFHFYHEQATNPELNLIHIPLSATAAICNFSPSHPSLQGVAHSSVGFTWWSRCQSCQSCQKEKCLVATAVLFVIP